MYVPFPLACDRPLLGLTLFPGHMHKVLKISQLGHTRRLLVHNLLHIIVIQMDHTAQLCELGNSTLPLVCSILFTAFPTANIGTKQSCQELTFLDSGVPFGSAVALVML